MVQKGADGPLWTTLERLQACHVWPFWKYLGHEWQVMGPKQVFYLYLVPDDLVKVS